MANKIYVNQEAAVTFGTNTDTVTCTIKNLAAGAGRVSAQLDRGAGARAEEFEWRAKFTFATTPVVGEAIDLYLSPSDGSIQDGDLGTSDADVDGVLGKGAVADVVKNLYYLGSVVVQKADATQSMKAGGRCRIASRYVSLVVHNNTADALGTVDADQQVRLIPSPAEMQ